MAEDIVLADVDQLVAAGAGISVSPTPTSSTRRTMPVGSWPGCVTAIRPLTFDATIKVEHLLRYPQVLAELAESGCAFVVSAFESVSDRILGLLDKGHTVADMSEAVIALRSHGIEIRPSGCLLRRGRWWTTSLA